MAVEIGVIDTVFVLMFCLGPIVGTVWMARIFYKTVLQNTLFKRWEAMCFSALYVALVCGGLAAFLLVQCNVFAVIYFLVFMFAVLDMANISYDLTHEYKGKGIR